MIVQADGGGYAFDSDPEQARRALATVAATGREALEDMRRLVGVLRGTGTAAPPADGLGEAAGRRAITMDGLDTLVERARSAGLQVVVQTEGVRPVLAPAVELAAYRTVQEALTNVLRHAGRHARVALSVGYRPDALTLSIVDDGGERLVPVGVTDHRTSAAGTVGNGLVGMRERVAVHGGTFRAGPRLDGGWAVTVTLPVPDGQATDRPVTA
jgi:signal transduction histidine kinase